MAWSAAMAFIWLTAEHGHPQPPGAYASGGAGGGVAGRAAGTVGLTCMAMALVLSSHLGR